MLMLSLQRNGVKGMQTQHEPDREHHARMLYMYLQPLLM